MICAKKHKVRSQCNGIRDPTTYIRHAALLTPKGLDNDFNYLTSVERKLSIAKREAVEKGVVHVGEGSPRGRAHGSGSVSRLERMLHRSGAVILRAPTGLARARNNATRLIGKYVIDQAASGSWVLT